MDVEYFGRQGRAGAEEQNAAKRSALHIYEWLCLKAMFMEKGPNSVLSVRTMVFKSGWMSCIP